MFEQEAERARDVSDFSMDQQKQSRIVDFKDYQIDFNENQLKAFDHFYLVSKFGEGNIDVHAAKASQMDEKYKSFFNEVEVQSTRCQHSHSVSPNSEKDYHEEKGICLQYFRFLIFCIRREPIAVFDQVSKITPEAAH